MPRSIRFTLLLLVLLAVACQAAVGATPTGADTLTTTLPASPTASPSPVIVTPARTGTRVYPTPRFTPLTPIPPPQDGIYLPDEVQVLLLLGSDLPAPFVGRSDAVMLVFYHPRLGKASLLSLPPDLFLYLPGYTMQRLQIAFAVGESRLAQDTIEYNLGVRPRFWAFVGMNDFVSLVNDLGGLDLNIVRDYPQACGGIPAGPVYMNGEQTLCFVRFRVGVDETDRSLRQQEALRQILLRLARGGALARLPELYVKYRHSVASNLTLPDVLGFIPLLLKLGDPGRIGFFSLGESDFTVWDLPGDVKTQVLLPDYEKLKEKVQSAINFVLIPAPYSEIFSTLEAELTTSPTPTIGFETPRTPTLSQTPPSQTGTPTLSPTVTLTPTPGDTLTLGPSPTVDLTGYP